MVFQVGKECGGVKRWEHVEVVGSCVNTGKGMPMSKLVDYFMERVREVERTLSKYQNPVIARLVWDVFE